MDELAHRIRAALVAFAAGDALGVPWEGCAPEQVAALEPLGVREGWPRGATSDDTAQLLLAAEALIEAPDAPERPFLARLSAALPAIRGAGPTTTAAIARYRETGALAAEGGTTNGAMMRAPVVGWAFADADRRREVGERLARATHGGYDAVEGACAIAELAAAGLEGRLEMGGDWPAPPFSPLAFDARPTLDAIVHVLAHHHEPVDAMRAAVRLGGDTDTVAALAGGLLGAGGGEIPWLDEVLLPPPEQLDRLAQGLAALRGLSAEASG